MTDIGHAVGPGAPELMERTQPPHASIKHASASRRPGAFLLEMLFVLIAFGIIGWIWEFFSNSEIGLLLIVAAVWMLCCRNPARRGQSPGTGLLGLCVIRRDGGVPSTWKVLARDWLLRGFFGLGMLLFLAGQITGVAGTVLSFGVFGVFVLGGLWLLWDTNRQCLWDKVVGMHVVPVAYAQARSRVLFSTQQTAKDLRTLEDLRDRGLLTDEEYQKRRARALERL